MEEKSGSTRTPTPRVSKEHGSCVRRHFLILIAVLLATVLICVLAADYFNRNQQQSPGSAQASPMAIIDVPLARQATSYTCGVACVQSVLGYCGYSVRQDALADEMGTTYADGTAPQAIVDALNARGLGSQIQENMTLDELKASIDKGQPVICAIQAWDDQSGIDYTDVWSDGHYVVAIGYGSGRVYFMDPSTLGNYTYIDDDEFLSRWHDERDEQQLIHMGIVPTSCTQAYDPSAYVFLG